jgi:hypothetical protein
MMRRAERILMPYDMDVVDRDSRADRGVLFKGRFPSEEAAVRAIAQAFRDARDAGRDGQELAAVLWAATGGVTAVLATREYLVDERAFSRFSNDVAGDDLLVALVTKRRDRKKSIAGRLSALVDGLNEVESQDGR